MVTGAGSWGLRSHFSQPQTGGIQCLHLGDRLPPGRPHLLSIPKQPPTLGLKCLDYGGHLIQTTTQRKASHYCSTHGCQGILQDSVKHHLLNLHMLQWYQPSKCSCISYRRHAQQESWAATSTFFIVHVVSLFLNLGFNKVLPDMFTGRKAPQDFTRAMVSLCVCV